MFFYLFLLYALSVYLVISRFFGGREASAGLLAGGASASSLIRALAGLLMLAGVPPFLGALYKFVLIRTLVAGHGWASAGLFVGTRVWLLYVYLRQSLGLLIIQGRRARKMGGGEMGRVIKLTTLLLPRVLWAS